MSRCVCCGAGSADSYFMGVELNAYKRKVQRMLEEQDNYSKAVEQLVLREFGEEFKPTVMRAIWCLSRHEVLEQQVADLEWAVSALLDQCERLRIDFRTAATFRVDFGQAYTNAERERCARFIEKEAASIEYLHIAGLLKILANAIRRGET